METGRRKSLSDEMLETKMADSDARLNDPDGNCIEYELRIVQQGHETVVYENRKLLLNNMLWLKTREVKDWKTRAPPNLSFSLCDG